MKPISDLVRLELQGESSCKERKGGLDGVRKKLT